MCPPGGRDKVMHAEFRVGETTVMASDGRNQGQPRFEGFALAITASTEAEAERLFGGLVEGGRVVMALAKTFFSPRFGMATDRFGVTWMVMVAP
jgi:PhnB protein